MLKRAKDRLLTRAAQIWVGSALALGVSGQTASNGGNDPKIWAGVFTVAQADRGKTAFVQHCSNCHNQDLNGSVRGPTLKGERFLRNWENGSVNNLFTKI